MGMTQKQYEKILQDKNYLKAEYIDSNNRPVECMVLPCMNAGVVNPIIEFTPTQWFHWTTLGAASAKFKIDGVIKSANEVYEQISKMVNN